MGGRAKLALQAAAVAVVALLLALLGWQLVGREKGRGLVAAAAAGERPAAPLFELPLLDGEGTLALASFRGQPVVLNFWASWCEPCKDEAPLLESAWRRYRERGLVLIGIDAQDFRGDARRFVERYEVTYPNVHDGKGSTLGRFGVTGFPETWFLDAEGRIVDHVAGPVTAETLEAGIQAALESAA